MNFLFHFIAPLMVKLGPIIVWLSKFSPYFPITQRDGSPYMDRYWVIFPRRITGGWGVRVHVIHSSDEGRDLHDHPWKFRSIILKSGYFEVFGVFDHWKDADIAAARQGYAWKYERQTGKYIVGLYRKAGDVNINEPSTFHRVRLHEMFGAEQPATTLFFSGPKVQGWGFMVGGKKEPWRQYIDRVFGKEQRQATDAKLNKAFGR